MRLVQSSSQQDVLDRYAGEIPSYVHAGSLTTVGLSFDHPVAGPFALSSAFGWRLNPTAVGPTVQFHIGLDYAVACGTPVRAAADGTVVSAGEWGTGGLRLEIDHGDGLVTSYRHNSRLLVSPGDRVGRGDVISLSGTTGNSTGCHLHFGTTLDGQYVDPVQLLPAVPGLPRPLDAEDLERIRASAERATPAARQGTTDAAPLTGGQQADKRPVARSTAPQAQTPDSDGRAPGTPASEDRAPRPQSPSPAQKPTSPGSPSGKPVPKPSDTATPDKPAQDKPKPQPAKPQPAAPTPAGPSPVQPKPSDPGTPAVTDPTEPAAPKPTEPAQPTPAKPTPAKPTPAKPTPSEPATPAKPTPAKPTPAKPAQPTPSQPAKPVTPPAPEALTYREAAQWCLPLDDADEKAPDFTGLFTGDFGDLAGLVAILDKEGLPEPATEKTLIEVSPSALWLESLPACSDAEFVAAAQAARSAG
jgi:hypothetical protein